jgi:hypothetical protein
MFEGDWGAKAGGQMKSATGHLCAEVRVRPTPRRILEPRVTCVL